MKLHFMGECVVRKLLCVYCTSVLKEEFKILTSQMLPSKSDCLLAKELFRVQLTLSNMLSSPLIAGGLLNVEI